MPLTRVQFEAELVSRAGGLMTRLGLSEAVDVLAPNTALNGPIAYTLRQAGYSVLDSSLVIDDDLANIAVADLDRLFDVAELRLLESLWSRATGKVTQQIGPQSRLEFSDIARALRYRIDALYRRISDLYGLGLSRLTAGVIAWPTAAPDPDAVLSE